MKIIFLEAVHNFGGSSKSTLELAERLVAHKHEVIIVDYWGSSEEFVNDCVDKDLTLEILDQREFPILLKTGDIFNTSLNYLKYWKIERAYKRRMLGIINGFQPDLIVVNNIKTLSILNKSIDYKIAYFARGWFLPNKIGRFTKWMLKKKTDVFLAVSQATKQMVYANGLAPLSDIFVVPNAINLSEVEKITTKSNIFPWYVRDNQPFILMHCGTFIKTKGHHITIEILKKLLDKGFDVRLLLIGLITQSRSSKAYYERLRKLTITYNIEDKVEFIVNQNNILSYFTKSDILVHPSYSEGLPRVVLEAMAFGKPVIGNAVGGMTDLVINNFTGYLPNFNVIEEYVEYIEILMKNKHHYKFLSHHSLELVKHNYTEMNQVNSFNKIKLSRRIT